MLFVVCFVIPAMVMVYCYSRFVWSVTKVNRDVRSFQSTTNVNPAKNRMETPLRLALLVAILCLAFFVCWVPFHVFHIVRAIGLNISSTACTNLRDLLSTMAYLNACINPILYSVSVLLNKIDKIIITILNKFMGARFRRRAKSVLIDRPLMLTRRVSSNFSEITQSSQLRFSAASRSRQNSINRMSFDSRLSVGTRNSVLTDPGDGSPLHRRESRTRDRLMKQKSLPIPEEECLSLSTDI